MLIIRENLGKQENIFITQYCGFFELRGFKLLTQ